MAREGRSFYAADVLTVAPQLIGMDLVLRQGSRLARLMITEVEAYRGAEDWACHARRGRTPRTEPMYAQGGTLYIYLVYGLHWMLNIVTGPRDEPQAVLIRGVEGCAGPGRVTRRLGIDKSYNFEDLCHSERIWVEPTGRVVPWRQGPRIGIDYAGPYWATRPWRFWAEGHCPGGPRG